MFHFVYIVFIFIFLFYLLLFFLFHVLVFFFFKQKTAYEMRISDWSSDVCSSDLLKEAYVKARYSKHYRITEAELRWLGERVEELGRAVHAICSERIALLKAQVK